MTILSLIVLLFSFLDYFTSFYFINLILTLHKYVFFFIIFSPGVFPDGDLVPLTLRQRIFFKDSLSKLTYKISKVRRDCREIVEVIESFQPWELDVKNTRLIRHFILECLSPFKRHALETSNATYDQYRSDQSSWLHYILVWCLITGIFVFFIYWIFAWAVYQGDDTLRAWGTVYVTAFMNDIILVQVVKVFILYYLPTQAMQSQLIRIRKVLSDVSMNYINKKEEKDDYNTNRRPSLIETNSVEIQSEISVVQHMSATCRAAWSPELKSLPSAWLLRQVSERERERE